MLGEGVKSSSSQSHELDSWGEQDEVAVTGNELERTARLHVAMEKKRSVPNFLICFCGPCCAAEEKRWKTESSKFDGCNVCFF